jgi:hypothetical protein
MISHNSWGTTRLELVLSPKMELNFIRGCFHCHKEFGPGKRQVVGDAHFHAKYLIDYLIKTGGSFRRILEFRPWEKSQ